MNLVDQFNQMGFCGMSTILRVRRLRISLAQLLVCCVILALIRVSLGFKFLVFTTRHYISDAGNWVVVWERSRRKRKGRERRMRRQSPFQTLNSLPL